MIHLGTITSQGQLTIPVALRNLLGLGKASKIMMTVEKDRLVIEPTPDIFKLKGALSHYSKNNKGKNTAERIKIENEAMGQAIVERYQRKKNQK